MPSWNEALRSAGAVRDFVRALTSARRRPTAVIAEVKRKSPSAGWLRPPTDPDDFDPVVIARAYGDGGASAISCLTDCKYFGGSPSYIQRIRSAVSLPVLRKDFLIDPWQVDESRAIGADAILLIAECLADEDMEAMAHRALDLDLAILFEAHDRENLERVVRISGAIPHDRCLFGINNRDLRRMVTDLGHSIDLAGIIPDRSRLVSESGIRRGADIARLGDAGISIVLVGEHLMRQKDPGMALRELLGEAEGA